MVFTCAVVIPAGTTAIRSGTISWRGGVPETAPEGAGTGSAGRVAAGAADPAGAASSDRTGHNRYLPGRWP